ncbi:fungal-specific transcription factor domain-containing protein [Apiospora arundinis]|uniref:Fungal-specific transcription factor domain-containing protein n=1 Tax=Apiospora arundinis TaxID=335852 RepID=A0ABR2IEV3_9PEZI
MVDTTDTAASEKHPLQQDGNDDDHNDEGSQSQDDSTSHRPRKRQRVRLSCLECRRRKLSCSRELPCDRCVKSGTPERCNYEARPTGDRSGADRASSALLSDHGLALHAGDGSHPLRGSDATVLRDAARDHDRIRRLELEVSQLRNALSKQASLDGTTVASPSALRDAAKESPPSPVAAPPGCPNEPSDGLEFKFVKGNQFKARYFGPHNSWSSFYQLHGLMPFMRETADQWLRPLNIQLKDRAKRKEDRDKRFLEPDASLEALLPAKTEVDLLVNRYLDHFEQIHRILHIPSFWREYNNFWDPTTPRYAAFTALVLAILAISNSLDEQAAKFVGVKSSSFQTAERWIKACDVWLDNQSQKHRKLIHYQIVCLLHVARRINVIKKKRQWSSSAALVADGISVGLHRDPDSVSTKITPFYSEMRRRLWATMMEFDIQASFEQGLPTMLSQLDIQARAPLNIDDDAFDEDSESLPISHPSDKYTFASYQHISRQSLQLRLELSQVLSGPTPHWDWEQATKYRDLVLQEIDSLPSLDQLSKDAGTASQPILGYTLLHLQLRQYLIPLHQPFLKLRQYNSKYQVAEYFYYNAARDLVLMHDRLFQQGMRALYFLRDDASNAAMNLAHVSLLQPKGPLSSNSMGLIISNSNETIRLMEKCLVMKEDRILRVGNNDPWGYSSLCAAIGLLETHLGIKTPDAAKASSAERFISLHYKLLAYQTVDASSSQPPSGGGHESSSYIGPKPNTPASMYGASPLSSSLGALTSTTTMAATPTLPPPVTMPWSMAMTSDPGQSLGPNPDYNLDLLGTNLNDLWGIDFSDTFF